MRKFGSLYYFLYFHVFIIFHNKCLIVIEQMSGNLLSTGQVEAY
jgi:hypothetical protein